MAGADPTGGGIGQAAGELLKEMQKAQAEMQQADQRRQAAGPNEAFAQAMTHANQHSGSQAAQSAQAGRVQNDNVIDQVKRDERIAERLTTTKVGQTEKAEQSQLSKMLENLINGQDKMTKIMHVAMSGKQFSPNELIAMQAGVYRFSQELDLTSKVVEKATGGIKQTLNTQV